MTAKELRKKLNINNSRLNQYTRDLTLGVDYYKVHAKLFIYNESAVKIIMARQKKYRKSLIKNKTKLKVK